MHGGELLRLHGPHGRHCCLCSRAVLCGVSSCLFKLPYGSISIFRRFDDLHQLSHGHLFGIHRLYFVRKLYGMHGGELLRLDWSHGRYCCLRHGDLFYRLFNGLFELRDWCILFLIRLVWLHKLLRWILPRKHWSK